MLGAVPNLLVYGARHICIKILWKTIMGEILPISNNKKSQHANHNGKLENSTNCLGDQSECLYIDGIVFTIPRCHFYVQVDH